MYEEQDYTPTTSWIWQHPGSLTSSIHVEGNSDAVSVRSIVDAYWMIDVEADTRILQNEKESKEDLDRKQSRLNSPQLEHLYSVQLNDQSFDMADHSSDNRLHVVIQRSLSNTLVQFNNRAIVDIRVLRNGILLVESEVLLTTSSLYSHMYDTCIVHLYNGSKLRLEKCTPNIFRYTLLELERFIPSEPIPHVKGKKKSFRLFKRSTKKAKAESVPDLPKRAHIWNTKRQTV